MFSIIAINPQVMTMSFLHHFGLLGNAGGGISAPFHPMLVNFTVALIPVSFLFDLLGAWLAKEQFRSVGWWTLLAAAVVTPFTALAGWLWMRSMDHVEHGQMAVHQWLGISLAIVIVALAAWRGWLQWRGSELGWLYAVSAAIAFGALIYQGELGASMSFGRGIVVSSDSDSGHEQGPGDAHDHKTRPKEPPAQTRPQTHRHGDHEHGNAAQSRDPIAMRDREAPL